MFVFIVPCFNEASRFDLGYWNEITGKFNNCNFIFVDDGSTDETLHILGNIVAVNIEIVHLAMNQGKAEAVRRGFLFALEHYENLDFLGFIDSDGAFATEDISAMILLSEKLLTLDSDYTSVISSRVALAGRRIDRNSTRHYLGRLISTFLFSKWHASPYDSQSGFKIFKVNGNFLGAIKFPFRTTWFFDIELLIRLASENLCTTWEAPLSFWREVPGSKIRIGQFPKVLKEIFLVKKILNTHTGRNGETDGSI